MWTDFQQHMWRRMEWCAADSNRRPLLLAFFLVPCLSICPLAQQVVAPTQEKVGPTRGDDWGGYNIVNSFETGYRFVTLGGNHDTYRSTENFGNGVRLLGSYLTVNSRNGHGKLFDEIVLTTQGLGGDPYQNASLRVQKNRIYEYALHWRQNDYFNPGLVTGGGQGQHLLNTTYSLQDHDLTLFPQSHVRFFLGYTRDTQSGAGISTALLFNPAGQFDPTGNVFPLFSNVRRQQNEYRFGGELRWHGFTFNVIHGWQYFRDDTSDQFNGTSRGDDFNPNSILNSFSRSMPYRGTSPYWRAALFGDYHWININGRITYTGGNRDFVTNELALGANQFGAAANQQIVTLGNASRPVGTGNLTVTFFPTSKLTIVEQASLYNVRTDGTSAYLQFNNATQAANVLYYQFLGIRTGATETDILYHARDWLDVHAAYQYSDRKIVSTPQFAVSGSTQPYSQTNILNTGIFGFRLRPIKPLTISVDGELGRANQPLTPKSDRDYTALTARVQYRYKSLQLLAWMQSDYNENSVTLSEYNSKSRTYAASASWSPRSWFGFDATYSKAHVDTVGGIQFFANAQLFPNQFSYYVSNLHSGTLGIRLSPLKRLDLYLGYSRVQDTGDGRNNPFATTIGPSLPAFQMAQTYPLTFQSPMGRLSVRISERLRWNLGYQYFGYRADFSPGLNYLANTGYTSVLWSF